MAPPPRRVLGHTLPPLSVHSYKLESSPAKVERDGGVRIDVTAEQFPILSGMALAGLTLEPGAAREPHWHPNAAELGYCLGGAARMTIVEPGGSPVTVAIEPGDLVFVPPGYVHDIESTSEQESRFLICFSDERYQDLNLSSSLAEMPAHVLEATFGVPPGTFDWVAPVGDATFIVRPDDAATPPEQAAAAYRYQLEGLEPQVKNAGGSLILARADDFPILSGLAMYSLRMGGRAVREPHWHPNAAELNYVIEGSVRLTIVSPGGEVETVDLEAGDLSFIPRAYFHHIESLTDEESHLAVFFDHELPSDNGVSGALTGYQDGLLAAVFRRPSDAFTQLPGFDADVLLSPPPPES